MPKNVIVLVTDAKALKRALPGIAEWIGRLAGDVSTTLLHVAKVVPGETAEVGLRELAEEFAQHGVRAEVKLRTGDVVREVVREAYEEEAFAIILCTDGRAELSRTSGMVGEVADYAPCPVVVFKPRLLRFTDRAAAALTPRAKRLRTPGFEQN